MIRAVYGLSHGELRNLLGTLEDDERRRAIEADLIGLGLRLRYAGTDALMWHELYAVVTNLPATSALSRVQDPEGAGKGWGLTELLLAEATDALRVANWQRGGGTRRDYPKPIPRPGIEPESTTYGKGALPVDEMAAWLGDI